MNPASSRTPLGTPFAISSAHGRWQTRLRSSSATSVCRSSRSVRRPSCFRSPRAPARSATNCSPAHGLRGVTVMLDTLVTDVVPSGGRLDIHLQGRDPIEADAVILASGGLSVPNTGSDGMGLQIAERLGHVVHQTYAALTPLTDDIAPFAHLSGVSLPVTITARSERQERRTRRADFSLHIAGTADPLCSMCRTSPSVRLWSRMLAPASPSNGRPWAKLSGLPSCIRADREPCCPRSARLCLVEWPRCCWSGFASIPPGHCLN